MQVALGSMQLLYANHFNLVLKLTAVPPPPKPLVDGKWLETEPDPVTGKRRRLGWVYADKGWTTFESSVWYRRPASNPARSARVCLTRARAPAATATST